MPWPEDEDDEAIFSVEVISVGPYSYPLRAVGELSRVLRAVSVTLLSFPLLGPGLLILSSAGFAPKACAADVRHLGIAKLEYFIQTADEAPIYDGPGPFAFYAFVDEAATNSVLRSVVDLPDARSETLLPSETPLTLDFLDYYDNPLVLDLLYPPGRYSLSVFGANDGLKSISFDLPESFFPNAPRLLDWPALQAIQADQPFQFRWEPFAEGQRKDLVHLSIRDADNKLVFSTPDQPGVPDALDGTTGSLTLPAHALQPGTYYSADLTFARVVAHDTNSYSGVSATVSFVRLTAFEFVTAGTPDLAQVQFQLSFIYFADGGDFQSQTKPAPSWPMLLDNCYVARLRVDNEAFAPIASDVVFSSPAGTTLTNLPAEFRYVEDGSIYFETPCLSDATQTLPGSWIIRYDRYPIRFDVPEARLVERFVVPLPAVTVETNLLKSLQWAYTTPPGNPLPGVPAFITNQIVQLYDRANFATFTSAHLPAGTTSLSFTNGLVWDEVGRVAIFYRDDLGNWYATEFYHSRPGDLEIADDLLPLGSLATPYSAQLMGTNGVPPYIWSIEGALPPGLSLNPASGVISGLPTARGQFHFFVRIEDQAKNFEQEQYYIAITTNGPPVILEQPGGGFVEVGDFTVFEVEAEGTQPLGYQWFYNGAPLLNQTNASLALVNISTNQAGDYSVRITNSLGSAQSMPATLKVLSPPVILRQPASQTVPAGTDVTFTIEVASAPPVFFQWRRNGEFIEGATNSFHAIPNAQPFDAGIYDVLVAGPEGFAVSDDASLQFLIETLTLTNAFANRVAISAASGLARGSNGGANREPGEPIHSDIPGGSSVWITWIPPADGIAMFTTRGSAFDTVLAVYTGQTLSQLREITSDDDGAEFYASVVRFNAQAGQRYEIAIDGVYGSQGEILLNWTLDTRGGRLPVILRQPVDAIVSAGSTALFSLSATNPPPAAGPLSYQWYFNGLAITGATNEVLSIANVSAADLGLYFATVANAGETILSDLVVIQINFTDGVVDQQVATEDKFADVGREISQRVALQSLKPRPRPQGSVARGYTGSQIFSTVGSTSEAGEPAHCGIAFGGASQWFSYLAEASGELTLDTEGSDFDTVLAVYTGPGDDFASLTSVACDNDSGADGRDSRVTFPAQAGTIYFIAVDGVDRATGTARVNFRLIAPSRLQASVVSQEIRLRVTGPAGRDFTIESSPDLRAWTRLLTTNALTSVLDWSVPIPPLIPTQFYRVRQGN